MPSGGSRKHAGRLPQHIPGQTTLFGAPVDPREDRNRRRQAVQTVEESISKKKKEEEAERKKAATAECLRNERISLRERREIEVAQQLVILQSTIESNSSTTADDDEDDDEEEDEHYNIDEDDEIDEDDGTSTSQQSSTRKRSSYQPPTGSPLKSYLDGIKQSILCPTNRMAREGGKCWYAPSTSAISTSSIEPFTYCQEATWVYHYDPFVQFVGKLDKRVAEFRCMHCGTAGTLKDNGWHWRPMHHFQHVVWLLHRRLKCQKGKQGGCGRTFTEFHPEFMGQFPSAITERFPFLCTLGGLGMHKSMMNQFIGLCTKGVLFGTYCNSINEMRKTHYFQDHLSYLDILHDKIDLRSKTTGVGGVDDTFVPRPFMPFDSPGHYNGILMKPGLLRVLFLRVMKNLEPYLQTSFQMHPDESESSDHSFKFAKMISASNRCGKVFTASYDSISLSGMCTFNRFVHTKANDEIRPLLQKYREVRINAGALELKRTEGDGGADRNIWPEIFPELVENTQKPQTKSNQGLPTAMLPPDTLTVFETLTEVRNWALAMSTKIASLPSTSEVIYGLDSEWNLDDTRDITRVLAISLPEDLHDKTIVMDLTTMGLFAKDDFPKELRALLENQKLIPQGVNVSADLARLRRLGVNVARGIELMDLAKQLQPEHGEGYGLQKLSARFLHIHVDKTHQTADWREMHNSPEMQNYAGLDPYLHRILGNRLQELVAKAQADGKLQIPENLAVGSKVNIMYRNKKCGSGLLLFIGGHGEIRRWGQTTVGRGKALLMLEEASPNVRPAFSYTPTAEDLAAGIKGWDHSKVSLAKILKERRTEEGLVVAWPVARVRIEVVPTLAASTSKKCSMPDEMGHAAVDQAATNNADQVARRFFRLYDNLPDEEDDSDSQQQASPTAAETNIPRTRQKSDRFHVFNSFPSSRDPETKAALKLIRRLVIQGSLKFDRDDWGAMTEFLSKKHGISNLEDILDNFHCNREYWYRRVRIYPPSASQGVSNVRLIKRLVKQQASLNMAWGPNLEDYFLKLEEMFANGSLEECGDVELYQWDGTDKYGLDVWLRRRGSNRSELLHQKMKVAFGPHGVGAEVGHYLLLLVSYIFNVSTGIRRKRCHDFGMPWHDLIDRIQIRTIQIFGVDIFPKHDNQALFTPVEGFVAVGVGPLNYDATFVGIKEGPESHLKGDMRFLAERMELRGPPLHIAHPYEKKIFNDFMKDNPQRPGSNTWTRLAAIFKTKSDYRNIFPKLPSMLHNYYNSKWKATQDLVLAKERVKLPYYELLVKMSVPTAQDHDNNVAATFQKQAAEADKAKANEDFQLEERSSSEERNVEWNMNRVPVPPAAAPTQAAYIATACNDGRATKARKCVAAFLGCNKLAIHCARKDWRKCLEVVAGKLQQPANEETARELKRQFTLSNDRDRKARSRRKA